MLGVKVIVVGRRNRERLVRILSVSRPSPELSCAVLASPLTYWVIIDTMTVQSSFFAELFAFGRSLSCHCRQHIVDLIINQRPPNDISFRADGMRPLSSIVRWHLSKDASEWKGRQTILNTTDWGDLPWKKKDERKKPFARRCPNAYSQQDFEREWFAGLAPRLANTDIHTYIACKYTDLSL